MANEHSKWRTFLQPVAAALATFLAAGAIYLQRSGAEENDGRVTALEIKVETLQQGTSKLGADMDNLRVLLSDVRSDVSFIRGKIESKR